MRRLVFCLFASIAPLPAAPDGRELYQQNCAMCHGAEGVGMAGVFPPLAKSDFIVKHRTKALRGPMEGLSGPIEVNGVIYNGGMPPAFLDDDQLAAVFNHVFSSWGNDATPVTVEEITKLRATTRFPTLEALKASMLSENLPAAPEGWALTLGAELGFSPTRLAAHPDGRQVLAISENGEVWAWTPGAPAMTRLIRPDAYIDPSLGIQAVMGLTVDAGKRLYITCNQCDKSTVPVLNRMTVFRTEPWTGNDGWSLPKPWFKTSSPFGIGPYNHGLSHIAQGPDGMLYLNSGARTDGDEPGKQPNYSTAGEEPNTAAIWRMNPEDEAPSVEIFARGLRNSYGFCWDEEKRMIATDNGPDAHAPEELNLIEHGRHYGFPFQFSDWTKKPYPHTPDTPAGLQITGPFRNLGPDGIGTASGLSTFDPHSCPTGIVWLGKDWPAPLGGSFVTTRFGNMIKLDQDVGFDVVQLLVDFETKSLKTKRLLSPLGRPVDVLKLPGHRMVIAEYSRATNSAAGTGTPGRLLLLEPK